MNPEILETVSDIETSMGKREPFCWPFDHGNERREETHDRDNDTHQRSLLIGMREVRLLFSPCKGAL